jgi:COX assembly protein 2
MHPPLDRPHPDCQEAIQNLKKCHQTQSKWKFWACNDIKYELDRCFKSEKQEMLKRVNREFTEEHAEERKLVEQNWEEYWIQKKIEKDEQRQQRHADIVK